MQPGLGTFTQKTGQARRWSISGRLGSGWGFDPTRIGREGTLLRQPRHLFCDVNGEGWQTLSWSTRHRDRAPLAWLWVWSGEDWREALLRQPRHFFADVTEVGRRMPSWSTTTLSRAPLHRLGLALKRGLDGRTLLRQPRDVLAESAEMGSQTLSSLTMTVSRAPLERRGFGPKEGLNRAPISAAAGRSLQTSPERAGGCHRGQRRHRHRRRSS